MGHAASAPFEGAASANVWLDDIAAALNVSAGSAYEALTATLHAMRDCLAPEEALEFADHLPPAFRGAYLDGWHAETQPVHCRTAEDFQHAVQTRLPTDFPAEPEPVAQAVIDAMLKHSEPSDIARAVAHLPKPMRVLWTDDAA
jgi:uncharacterized protein (DUF2267 family)